MEEGQKLQMDYTRAKQVMSNAHLKKQAWEGMGRAGLGQGGLAVKQEAFQRCPEGVERCIAGYAFLPCLASFPNR